MVVETAEHGFDAAQVYREASPGRGHDPLDLPRRRRRRRGLRLRARQRAATSSPTPTWSPTNRAATRKAAKEVFVEFPDRNVVPAKIVGFDPFADVALLKVEPDGFDLHPLQLGDDNDLSVGQPVAAIGSPFGEQQSLSVGVVSATDRSVESLTKFQIEGAIQTDASINPGNSGGPLLDAGARVLGINEQIETELGRQRRRRLRRAGLGDQALGRPAARKSGEAEYAYIGVSTQPLYPQLADKLGLDTDYGALLAEVVAGRPGRQGGARRAATASSTSRPPTYETGGDVILAIDGHKVVQPDDLARYIAAYRPGREGRARDPPRQQARGGRGDIGQTTAAAEGTGDRRAM